MIAASAAYLAELAKSARTPIYQIGLAPPRIDIPTPVFYAKLDEASGTRADSIGVNSLTQHNGVLSVTGKFGSSASFAHSYAAPQYLSVNVGTGNALQRGDRNWGGAAYVRLNSWPNASLDIYDSLRVICGQWDYDTGVSWRVYYDRGTDAFRFGFGNIPSPFTTETWVSSAGTHAAIHLNRLYLIQWWHNASINVMQIQVDDNPPAGKTTSEYAQVSTRPFTIGSEYPSVAVPSALGWDGDIDEVAIWDQTLTDSHRLQLFNSGDGLAIEDYVRRSSYEFCTSNPMTGEDLGYPLLEPISLDQSAEVERSRMPLYELVFKLHDMDERITQILADSSLVGWDVKFHAGFYDVAWTQTPSSEDGHVQLFGGIVTEVKYEDGAYTVTARNRMAAAWDKIIFNGAATILTAGINSTDTSCSVADTSAFEYPAFDPQSMRKLLECDGELFNYRSKTDTSFGDLIRPGATGFFVPPATAPSASHSAGATVREMIKLASLNSSNANAAADDSLHPVEQLKTILMDTGKYGVGESGIAFNLTQFNTLKAALGPELQFRWIYAEGVNAKQFIEEEIYFPCGMYPICSNTGELGGKLFQGAADAVAIDTIGDADIIGQPKWIRNAEHMANMVVVDLDYLPTTHEHKTQFIYRDNTLVTAIGREIPLSIPTTGIRSEFSFGGMTWFETTADFLIDAAQRHIARFGVQAPVISVRTVFARQLLEIGDDLELDFSNAINLSDGTRILAGVPAEVVAMRHDFQNGTIDMQVLLYPT